MATASYVDQERFVVAARSYASPIIAYERAGFVYEGTLKDARFFEGRYYSVNIMSLVSSSY